MFFLKLYFRDEGHLYSKCLFDILTIYRKFHILHFFSRGIRMQISILTKVQNGWISLRKESVLWLKMFPLRVLFRNEGHLYANCLFYILSIYRKCFLFQFLCYGIRMQIPIQREVQNGRISHQKVNHNLLNTCTF